MQFIVEHVAEKGYPPSVREIGEEVGLSSPSSVHAHLAALVREGYIRRDPTRPRALEVRSLPGLAAAREEARAVPLVGRVAAGTPSYAMEEVEDVFLLPRSLVGEGRLFALRVRGDSMVGAGIFEGDLVVVREQPGADPGSIVAALMGEEATVKRLVRRGGRWLLVAENPNYEPLPAEGARILGKVVAVLRSLEG